MENWLKKFLIYAGLFVLIVLGVKYSLIYLTPFIIAAILASLINPIVERVHAWTPLNRGVSVFIVLTFIIALLVILIITGVSQVYLELNRLRSNIPDYSSFGKQLQYMIEQKNALHNFIDNLDISPAIRESLNDNIQIVYNAIINNLEKLIRETLNLISKLPIFMTILFLSFIATFFISRDKDKINQFIMNLFPQKWRTKVFKIEKELLESAVNYINAELILISITGIISWLGLTILGNQYALIIGITSAILDLIPIIGPALIFIPWIIYCLITENISYAFGLLIVYTLMAAVRQGAEGKIMGSHLGFHPLAILLALYVGFRIMGPLGFIIGPAVLVIIKALVKVGVIPIGSDFKE